MMKHDTAMGVCDADKCSACGVCINICPKGCISYLKKETGTKVAVINKNSCVNCHLCKKVCPQLDTVEGLESFVCYAAWSFDDTIRTNSASGGIATELYRFFSDKGYKLAGVSMTPMHTAEFSLSDSFESMPVYRNSKYVYSDAGNIYYEVGKNLVNQRGVLFIGLPCQVAALKKYLFVKKISLELLFTVDIVCHGTTPEQFLGEHIEHIEKKKKKKAIHVEFRDPEEKTSSFTFSLKDAEHTFYKRRVKANDVYQIGYHAGITYRDNCYSCQFATRKRQGDITLADFSYVGSYEFCSYSNEKVSCVLINSKKGESLFSELCSTDRIFYEKRPIEEEVTTEKQLNYPTRVPREREKFLKEIKSNNGFEKAMKYAARKIMIVNTVKNITHIEKIKQIMSEKLPPNVKNGIKKVLKR